MLRPLLVPEDVAAVACLESVLFPHNAMSEQLLEREAEAGFAWVIGSPPYAYALARDDGLLIDITRLGVAPLRHGQGCGSLLLDKILNLGRETILTVEKCNRRALRLYLRHGFFITGTLVTSDAWVMRCSHSEGLRCELGPAAATLQHFLPVRAGHGSSERLAFGAADSSHTAIRLLQNDRVLVCERARAEAFHEVPPKTVG